MIAINDFVTYFNNLKERVPGISKVEYVSTDEEVPPVLKDVSGTIMIVVFPSAALQGNLDSLEDINSSIIFILTKADHADLNSVKKIALFQQTQQTTLDARSIMLQDCADYSESCTFMHGLNTEDINIDPISYYRGWVGWGMVFEVGDS